MAEEKICPVCENEIPERASSLCPYCRSELKWLDNEEYITKRFVGYVKHKINRKVVTKLLISGGFYLCGIFGTVIFSNYLSRNSNSSKGLLFLFLPLGLFAGFIGTKLNLKYGRSRFATLGFFIFSIASSVILSIVFSLIFFVLVYGLTLLLTLLGLQG